MNLDDLRDELGDDARRQPPLSPDFRDGVAARVRLHRIRAALFVGPVVVAMILGAASVLPRGTQEASVSTADGGSGDPSATATTSTATTPPPGDLANSTTSAPPPSIEAQASSTSSIAAPGVTDPGGVTVPVTPPAGSPQTTSSVPVPGGGGTCGAVTIDAASDAIPDLAPVDCFLKAFNAGVAADVGIRVTVTGGGTITQHLTTTGDHNVTIATSGALDVELPDLSLDDWDDLLPDDTVPADGNCGSIEVPASTAITPTPGGLPSGIELAVMGCVLGAYASGSAAHLTVVLSAGAGGAVTIKLSISAAHVLRIELAGAVTTTLPPGVQLPEDLLAALPSGSLGLGTYLPEGHAPR